MTEEDKNTNENESPENKEVQEPTIKYVKPKFKRGAVALPQRIKIPHVVAAQSGISRQLLLQKEEEVPESAYEWLKADPRYTGWFTK